MLSQDPQNLSETVFTDIFSVSGCDFIFLVNSSGYIVYSEVSGSNSSTNASNLPEIRQRINDGSFLCKEAETPLKGLFLLENGPAVISSQPVLAAPENKEISGTIILGKKLGCRASSSPSRNITGNTVTLYSFNSMPPDFQQAFFESKNSNFTYTATGERVAGYSVLKDISGSPTIVVRTDADSEYLCRGPEIPPVYCAFPFVCRPYDWGRL